MSIAKPPLPNVSPGHPITAQAWNGILSAVGTLYDFVNTFGTETLSVSVLSGGQAVADAIVVAVPGSGPPVVAVPPIGAATVHVLTNLSVGNYSVHVAAPGFATVTQLVTLPTTSTLTVNLTATTAVMPNILGMAASNALATLAASAITVDLILDIYGEEVSKTALPADRVGSRVLSQFPLPGTRVVAASAATRFVVSAPPEGAEKGKEKDTVEKSATIDKAIADKVDKSAEKAPEKAPEKSPEKAQEKNPITDKTFKDVKDSEDKSDKSQAIDKAIRDGVLNFGAEDKGPLLGEKTNDFIPAPDSGVMAVFIPPDERPSVGELALREEPEEE